MIQRQHHLALTANEASVFEDFLLLLLFTSQIGKCVDDDTKNQVEHDNDDHEEEEHVIHYSSSKHGFLKQGMAQKCHQSE